MTTITVERMTCGHCEQRVEAAFQGISSVTDSTVDRESEQAKVEGEADVTALVQAVKDTGYTAHV